MRIGAVPLAEVRSEALPAPRRPGLVPLPVSRTIVRRVGEEVRLRTHVVQLWAAGVEITSRAINVRRQESC